MLFSVSLHSAHSKVRCFWKCTRTSAASPLSSFPSRFQAPSDATARRGGRFSHQQSGISISRRPYLLTADVSILPLSTAASYLLVKRASLTVSRFSTTYYRRRILNLHSMYGIPAVANFHIAKKHRDIKGLSTVNYKDLYLKKKHLLTYRASYLLAPFLTSPSIPGTTNRRLLISSWEKRRAKRMLVSLSACRPTFF